MKPVRISRSAPLLWDLDGTLVDTGRDLAQAVNRMLRDYGYAPLPDDTVVGHVGRARATSCGNASRNAVTP